MVVRADEHAISLKNRRADDPLEFVGRDEFAFFVRIQDEHRAVFAGDDHIMSCKNDAGIDGGIPHVQPLAGGDFSRFCIDHV